MCYTWIFDSRENTAIARMHVTYEQLNPRHT